MHAAQWRYCCHFARNSLQQHQLNHRPLWAPGCFLPAGQPRPKLLQKETKCDVPLTNIFALRWVLIKVTKHRHLTRLGPLDNHQKRQYVCFEDSGILWKAMLLIWKISNVIHGEVSVLQLSVPLNHCMHWHTRNGLIYFFSLKCRFWYCSLIGNVYINLPAQL